MLLLLLALAWLAWGTAATLGGLLWPSLGRVLGWGAWLFTAATIAAVLAELTRKIGIGKLAGSQFGLVAGLVALGLLLMMFWGGFRRQRLRLVIEEGQAGGCSCHG